MSTGQNRTLVLAAIGACVVIGVVGIWLVSRAGGASTEGSLTADVQKTSVTLTGVVPSQEVKSEIGARAAELVGGSANVTNDVQVDGGVAAGPWLEATIGAFAGLPAQPRPLRYSVSGGTLTIEATAASASEKSALLQIVTGLVEGRLKLDDQVVVAP